MPGEKTGPVHSMLERTVTGNALRFHMPGHKGLVHFPDAQYDLTELPGTDTLFEPADGILLAQGSAAKCWNAEHSFLLVNGSTAGIQAMMLWAAMQGRTPLLPRDSHISALYACAAADIEPLWLEPVWNTHEQLPQWNPDGLDALKPGSKTAIFITYPDYYGRCIGLDGICRQTAGHDSVLFVDSAHGAHFVFSDKLPPDAGLFADAWVSGAHKTLPAPTQTAFLHVKHGADAPAFGRLLRGITTTSPSWLLLAGLDNSRVMMQQASGKLDELIDNCLELAIKLNNLAGLRCWGTADARSMGYAAHDPTRLVVDVRRLGISGWEAGTLLRKLGVQAEMCDIYRVVLIATIMDNKERLDMLYQAFEKLTAYRKPVAFCSGMEAPPKSGKARLTLRQAWLSQAVEIPLTRSAGRIAAEPFGAYPPGIPLAMPGEEITKDVIDCVQESKALGGSFFGIRDGKVFVVSK